MVKIVFVCFLDQGHLQIPIALAKNLLFRDLNNEIYFVVDSELEDKIKGKCSQFKTLVFTDKSIDKEELEASRKERFSAWKNEDDREKFKEKAKTLFLGLMASWKSRQEAIRELIDGVQPDLVIVEMLFNLPFIMAMKYKWAMIVSTNPLNIADQVNYPPVGCGVNNDFKWYSDVNIKYAANFRKKFDDWYKECGLIRKSSYSLIEASPFLNVFLYPKMLNYFRPEDIPGRWHQLCTSIVKEEVNQFFREKGLITDMVVSRKDLLTEQFLRKPGKLILFSIGTLVSENVELFDKLIPVIGQCQHEFIVSKGKNGDQFELPSNCVGANYVNQLELLPIVDLFITHGGNNSFCEAFYFGTPMIIVPIRGDQHDNACRLETFDLGKKIRLHDFTKEELCSAIDYVSDSETIKNKMKEISQAMKEDDSMEQLCDLVIETCSKQN